MEMLQKHGVEVRVRRLAAASAAGVREAVWVLSTCLVVASCSARYRADGRVLETVEACCRRANSEMTHFSGCRTTPQCTEADPLWLRGQIICGAVGEQGCAGGRCCRYVVDRATKRPRP